MIYETRNVMNYKVKTEQGKLTVRQFAKLVDGNKKLEFYVSVKDHTNMNLDDIDVLLVPNNHMLYDGFVRVTEEYLEDGVGDMQKFNFADLTWFTSDSRTRVVHAKLKTKAFEKTSEATKYIIMSSYVHNAKISLDGDVSATVLGFDREGYVFVAVIHPTKGYFIDKIHCGEFTEQLNKLVNVFN